MNTQIHISSSLSPYKVGLLIIVAMVYALLVYDKESNKSEDIEVSIFNIISLPIAMTA